MKEQDEEPAFVYFISDQLGGPVKIGTTKHLRERTLWLQGGYPHPLHVLGVLSGDYQLEAEMHRRFAASRLQGEWFQRTPELMEFIRHDAMNYDAGVSVVQAARRQRDEEQEESQQRAVIEHLKRVTGLPFQALVGGEEAMTRVLSRRLLGTPKRLDELDFVESLLMAAECCLLTEKLGGEKAADMWQRMLPVEVREQLDELVRQHERDRLA